MVDLQGGDFSAQKTIFYNFNLKPSYKLLKYGSDSRGPEMLPTVTFV